MEPPSNPGRFTLPHEPAVVVTRPGPLEADRSVLFHIHGAIDDIHSLVVDFRDEFALRPWKADLARSLVRGRTVLILGFSGWDLDVSRILATGEPSAVIWTHREPHTKVAWSHAATELLSAAPRGRRWTVSVGGSVHEVLGSIAPAARPTEDPAAIEARYDALVPSIGPIPPWVVTWARWVAIRAGFWEVGPPRNDEKRLLSRSRRFELVSFCRFYAARHRGAARLQLKAARCSIQEGKGVDFVYHATMAAEDFNRAADTPAAIAVIWLALGETGLRLATRREAASRELLDALVDLAATALLAWPLPSLYSQSGGGATPVQKVASLMVKALDRRAFNKSMILSTVATPRATQAFQLIRERRQWLGLRHRMVNADRINACEQFIGALRRRDRHLLEEARSSIGSAVSAAALVRDRARTAKCLLLLAEIEHCHHGAKGPSTRLTKLLAEVLAEFPGCGLHSLDDVPAVAWRMIGDSEMSALPRELSRRVYFGAPQLPGRRGQRLRLFALSLLETS
jgi:hypothetical protein